MKYHVGVCYSEENNLPEYRVCRLFKKMPKSNREVGIQLLATEYIKVLNIRLPRPIFHSGYIHWRTAYRAVSATTGSFPAKR